MTPTFEALVETGAALIAACRQKRLRLAAAESCTGGLLAAVLTEVPGASDVFERGFVTYSNASKSEQLNVPADLIERFGAVSEEVAHAMASGALLHSHADLAIAVTGVAGPGGGTVSKPVGLVHLAAARRSGDTLHKELRLADIGRAAVRRASVGEALMLLTELVAQAAEASALP